MLIPYKDIKLAASDRKMKNGEIPPLHVSRSDTAPISEFWMPDMVFSVCCAADIRTWIFSSASLLKFVPSKHYSVIVPNDEVTLFKAVTDKKFNVIPETVFVGELKSELLSRMSDNASKRVGWYLQQFIKLSVLKEARPFENYLIWDADTVALKKIDFFEKSGKVQFYVGTEAHPPYFDVTKKLFGIGKVAPFSFIAQCFPCKGSWLPKFFSELEEKNKNWIHTICEQINFEEQSGFSEYETLGTYFYSHFRHEMVEKKNKWMRSGKALIGSVENVDKPPYTQLIDDFDHITFEKWGNSFGILRKQSDDFINNFLRIEKSFKQDLDEFFSQLFEQKAIRKIIQIGANDGVKNYPLRKHLSIKGDYEALLVEPLPYCANKLRTLYRDRSDVKIAQVAAGQKNELRELFYIPPEIASEMNGEGPQNDWAHGQGSFDKATIVHWIKANNFRGQKYVENISRFIDSITSLLVPVFRADHLLPRDRVGLLLLIDVQGFELDVLEGIDWTNPPQWVVVDDGLGNTFEMMKFFCSKGYFWIAGDNDKVFSRI